MELDLIERHHERLARLCEQFRVHRLDLFGSAAKGAFDPDQSDLDFLVAFDQPGERGYAMRYLGFAESLETLFGRPVDLLIDEPLANPYFRKSVEATRVTVYETRGPQAAV